LRCKNFSRNAGNQICEKSVTELARRNLAFTRSWNCLANPSIFRLFLLLLISITMDNHTQR
jgi:hypothetical protein